MRRAFSNSLSLPHRSHQSTLFKRSGSLPGAGQPRQPICADFELLLATRINVPVEQSLDDFLRLIFHRVDIMDLMVDPKKIRSRIYNLYSDAGGIHEQIEVEVAIQQARRGWLDMRQNLPEQLTRRAYFQHEKKISLNNPSIFKNSEIFLALDLIDTFLYFPIASCNGKYRVYLNVAFGSMRDAIALTWKLRDEFKPNIQCVKIAGPGANRCDAVVIYCTTEQTAENIACNMLEYIKSGKLYCADQTVPAMTRRIGGGVSVGAEPYARETGFAEHLGRYRRTPPTVQCAHSFGSLRSEVITEAIMKYRSNLHILGSGYTVFRQLVALSFLDYGLDPSRPDT